MRLTKIWLVSLVLFAMSAEPAASALRYTPQRTQGGLNFLVVEGGFDQQDDLAGFVSAVRGSGATVVVFDSPGGNVHAAMTLGRMIREMGLDTLQIRQMECASACALAFLGGVRRVATPGSIGVHRASFQPDVMLDRDAAVAGVQEITADILTYLKEMGVSQDLLSFALRYDASDMRYLSGSEMHALNVVTAEPASKGPAAAPPGPSESVVSAEAAAVGIVRKLLESDAQASLDVVAKFYAAEVSYYGRTVALSEVISDKRSYFARWPQRRYRIRDHSLETFCTSAFCQISGEYDYEVRSDARKRVASGAARFTFTISRGAVPRVVGEAGYVMK